MLQGELRSITLAIIAAAIFAPLLTLLLSRLFPPKVGQNDRANLARHRLRNKIIEYAGLVFLFTGFSLPFVVQGTDRLPPTISNIALIFACGFLSLVGGVAALAALFGDRNAENFLTYFEHERRISRAGTRTIAKWIVGASIVALLAVLYLTP